MSETVLEAGLTRPGGAGQTNHGAWSGSSFDCWSGTAWKQSPQICTKTSDREEETAGRVAQTPRGGGGGQQRRVTRYGCGRGKARRRGGSCGWRWRRRRGRRSHTSGNSRTACGTAARRSSPPALGLGTPPETTATAAVDSLAQPHLSFLKSQCDFFFCFRPEVCPVNSDQDYQGQPDTRGTPEAVRVSGSTPRALFGSRADVPGDCGSMVREGSQMPSNR